MTADLATPTRRPATRPSRNTLLAQRRPDAPWMAAGRSWAAPPPLPVVADPPWLAPAAASSRVLNCWYGEACTFAEDRLLAGRLERVAPALPSLARQARRYRRAALQAAFDAGIGQFLDLGAGIPTSGDDLPATVEGREVRAAYIDDDPVAVAALRDITRAARPHVVAVAADLATPDALLDLLTEHGVLDPAAPVVAVLSLVLHHLAEFQTLHLLDVLRRRLAGGSRLVVTAFVADPLTARQRDVISRIYRATPPLVLRTAAQTGGLLAEAGWPTPPPTEAGPAGLYSNTLHRQAGRLTPAAPDAGGHVQETRA